MTKIFDLLKLTQKNNQCEVLVENVFLILLGNSEDLSTSRFAYVFHITGFARNVDLILTILLKYNFSWISFRRSFICQKFWLTNWNLVHKFNSATLDIFLKIQLDSDSICKYENLKLYHSCEIYLTVHDGNHELDFCDRIPDEKH